MKTKTLVASMAVASLAMAQPISAATRSADSLPQRGAQSAVERVGSLDEESEDFRGRPIIAIGIVAIVAAALILLLSDGKSPG